MKRKKRRTQHGGFHIDTGREIKVKLPSNFVKTLVPTRRADGTVENLPVARGRAIIELMAKAMEVARSLRARVDEQAAIIEQYEKMLTEHGVKYGKENDTDQAERDGGQ